MGKSLDLSKSVYELLQQYPELKETMIEIGFKDLSNPAKLNTIGRIMTIPKGCLVKGFEIPVVLKQLEDAGYEPAGKKPAFVSKFLGKNGQVTEETEDALKAATRLWQQRMEQMKNSVIRRLSPTSCVSRMVRI